MPPPTLSSGRACGCKKGHPAGTREDRAGSDATGCDGLDASVGCASVAAGCAEGLPDASVAAGGACSKNDCMLSRWESDTAPLATVGAPACAASGAAGGKDDAANEDDGVDGSTSRVSCWASAAAAAAERSGDGDDAAMGAAASDASAARHTTTHRSHYRM